MSELSKERRDRLAQVLHLERCDMGHMHWGGCADALGRGCEQVVERSLGPLIEAWLAEERVKVLRETAAELLRERDTHEADDTAEGCESRFCRGWLLGQTFAAQRLQEHAHLMDRP